MFAVPHIALAQWAALIAVVEGGGYAQAAESLGKSQSAVTYAVQKIDAQLGVKTFEQVGRRAVLTPTGQMLYRRALALVRDGVEIEKAARAWAVGWESEISIAVEVIFPHRLLLTALARLRQSTERTRVEVTEMTSEGCSEALASGRADLAVLHHPPPGTLGELLIRLPLIPVAHPDHPLHQLGREISGRDLRDHRHIVVRETIDKRRRRDGVPQSERSWALDGMHLSLEAVRMGYGFAWFPEPHVRGALNDGQLRRLPLTQGGDRWVDLYLTVANPDFAGPGVRRLTELLHDVVGEERAAVQEPGLRSGG